MILHSTKQTKGKTTHSFEMMHYSTYEDVTITDIDASILKTQL